MYVKILGKETIQIVDTTLEKGRLLIHVDEVEQLVDELLHARWAIGQGKLPTDEIKPFNLAQRPSLPRPAMLEECPSCSGTGTVCDPQHGMPSRCMVCSGEGVL